MAVLSPLLRTLQCLGSQTLSGMCAPIALLCPNCGEGAQLPNPVKRRAPQLRSAGDLQTGVQHTTIALDCPVHVSSYWTGQDCECRSQIVGEGFPALPSLFNRKRHLVNRRVLVARAGNNTLGDFTPSLDTLSRQCVLQGDIVHVKASATLGGEGSTH